jgi:hypothetical protein
VAGVQDSDGTRRRADGYGSREGGLEVIDTDLCCRLIIP